MSGIDTPSLWEVEDDSTEIPHVRDMVVAPVTSADVHTFARRYHYSLGGGNAAYRWGLWHGAALYGVVAYNIPTMRTCASVFGAEHWRTVWHMGRLALPDKAPRNSESRLIGGSLRTIEATRPDVWAVLTFADSTVGHVGYVYQATNALYTGAGGNLAYYLDQQGRRRSSYLEGAWVGTERATDMGWTSHKGGEKHRYVYILGNKRERKQRLALLRLPILPYPKAAR